MTTPGPTSRSLLVNVQSNTCMDVSGADNRSVIGFSIAGTDNQLWVFTQASNGNFHIRSVRSGNYLTVAGQPHEGQRLIVHPNPFAWSVRQGAGGGIKFLIPGTNWVADLSGGQSRPGTPVILYRDQGSPNQAWRVWVVE